MTNEKLEQKIQELQQEIDNKNKNSRPKVGRFSKLVGLFSKLNQKILDSNGLMTKEGGYLCKAEWHAVAIPASMISASFMLPKPLGLLTFLSYLLMNKKGFELLQSDYEGHWNDVMEEYAYAAGSLCVTIAFWVYARPETIDGAGQINSIIAKLVLGA